MPVIWFTGFNGLIPGLNDNTFVVDHTYSPTSFQTGAVTNYVGRAVGRINNDDQLHAPYFRVYGRKYNANPMNGLGRGRVNTAPWDGNRKAFTMTHTKTSSGNSDLYAGFSLQTPPMSGGKSYRVGMRVYPHSVTGFSGSYSYTLVFANIASTPDIFYNWGAWTDGIVDKPHYIEIEWDYETQTVLVYRNGVLVTSKAMSGSSTLNGGFGVYTEMYNNTSSTFANRQYFSVGDMYWQTIESEADTALGPGTVVAQATPATDDVVQFTKSNNAYDSNAEVVNQLAGGDSNGNLTFYTGRRWLIGDAAGQQDLYNLNISDVTTNLASVEAVSIRTVANNPGTVPMTFAAIAKSGSVQEQSPTPSTVMPSTVSYTAQHLVLAADPSDGTRWDTTKLASLKIGTKLIS